MVDFVAVIEKAVNGLADNTPEMRDKVYEKARAAIVRQLDGIDPPISDAVKEKQLAKLEEAIVEVEQRNAEPDLDEDMFSDMFSASESPPPEPASRPAPPKPERPVPDQPPRQPQPPVPRQETGPEEYGYGQPGYDQFGVDNVAAPGQASGEAGYAQDYLADDPGGEYYHPRRGGLIRIAAISVVALLVIIGLVFALWFLRAPILSLFGSQSPSMQDSQSASPPDQDEVVGEPSSASSGEDTTIASREVTPPPVAEGDQKFTQRLLVDGSEVDAGPAAGSVRTTDQEGKSIASLEETATPPPPATPQSEPPETTASPTIGQKMFIYEERPGQQSPTAVEGSVIWSIVRESPGDDLPPEPAIQARISAPGSGLDALLTIKRNADRSLPASHLIEILFTLTEAFQGGSIDSIQNFAMKETEEATGDSLIAVPAKITDSFFMIALNDFSEAVQLNMQLLRGRNWIDLPVSYGNGRRALLTLEKGSTGAEVFDQVIRAWDSRSNTTTQSE